MSRIAVVNEGRIGDGDPTTTPKEGSGAKRSHHQTDVGDSAADQLNVLSQTTSTTKDASSGKRRHHRHHHRHRKQGDMSVDGDGADSSDAAADMEQEDKLKLLLEFIPYFGLGDATRDSMVRSILSAADAEELAGDRDEYDNTLLILACQYRCKGLVPLILAKGDGVIDVNAVNSAGACALHFTCYKDSICSETATLLLERGAKPEVVENTYGCTPLHYAAGAGDIDLCRHLVEAGAKVNTWDFYQYTAIDYAKQSGATDCVTYLEDISAPGATNAGQSVVKFSLGGNARGGGLVTSTGVPSSQLAGFIREDSFDSGSYGDSERMADADTSRQGSGLQHQHSSASDLSVGGEDREGYWERQCDPASGMTYYLNEKTGESMWEKDLLSQAQALGESLSEAEASPQLEQWLRQQTQRSRLIAYLGRHDPLKLMQVDEMLKQRLGDENSLFAELVKTYGEEEDPIVAGLIKDVARGFRDRKAAVPPAATMTPATFTTTSPKRGSNEMYTKRLVNVLGAATELRTAGGGRPPTAPSHGPGRRIGARPMSASVAALRSYGSSKELLASGSSNKLIPTAPVDLSKMQEHAQKRLDDAKIAHEEILEAERQAHRDKTAEGEGTIARLEHDIKEASGEEERLKAKAEEQCGLAESLDKQAKEAMSAQSGEAKVLSKEAATLRTELETVLRETQALADLVDKEQSGAAAAAESSRRDAEIKAKEESDLVHECQASIAAAKGGAERALKDFETRRRAEQQDIEDRLGKELARVQRELAAAKAKAATDVSKAQSDASAAKSKAESMAVTWDQVSTQREDLRVELERAAETAQRNTGLQGLVASESERRKKLHNKLEDLKGKIRVYVRVRPFSQKERARGCTEAVEAQGKQTIAVQDPRVKDEKTFDFDQVWSGTEEQGNNQINIFKDTGYLVTSAVDGYNVCIFAYGQTGSGKTYTMFGAGGVGGGVDASTGQCDGTAGVTPRAVLELFRVLKEREGQYEYSVKVSMFELYRDGLRDLLVKKGSTTKLVIKLAEHSGTGLVVVEGGVERDANDIATMIAIIQVGAEGRTVSSTQMNSDSSRSHLLCSIVVSSTNRRTKSCMRGKLTLVDLAGSERVGKSGASGDQLKEAQSINKSLSALGDVIGALTTGVKHIPYRNHALTMMMSDSLGGNSKTLMFVCASPADYNASETINALQFAARCKSVTNSAGGGGGGAAAAAQVQALRRELEKLKGEGGGKGPANTPIKLARPL